MPEWVALGRRQNDLGLMVDFHKTRAIVRANTSWIMGHALESIEAGLSGYAPGMVLIHKDWRDVYFAVEREHWDENDYFEFAERRFKELKIKNP